MQLLMLLCFLLSQSSTCMRLWAEILEETDTRYSQASLCWEGSACLCPMIIRLSSTPLYPRQQGGQRSCQGRFFSDFSESFRRAYQVWITGYISCSELLYGCCRARQNFWILGNPIGTRFLVSPGIFASGYASIDLTCVPKYIWRRCGHHHSSQRLWLVVLALYFVSEFFKTLTSVLQWRLFSAVQIWRDVCKSWDLTLLIPTDENHFAKLCTVYRK